VAHAQKLFGLQAYEAKVAAKTKAANGADAASPASKRAKQDA